MGGAANQCGRGVGMRQSFAPARRVEIENRVVGFSSFECGVNGEGDTRRFDVGQREPCKFEIATNQIEMPDNIWLERFDHGDNGLIIADSKVFDAVAVFNSVTIIGNGAVNYQFVHIMHGADKIIEIASPAGICLFDIAAHLWNISRSRHNFRLKTAQNDQAIRKLLREFREQGGIGLEIMKACRHVPAAPNLLLIEKAGFGMRSVFADAESVIARRDCRFQHFTQKTRGMVAKVATVSAM